MAKTESTKTMEKNIWSTTQKMGVFGCFEVTIGWGGRERVDYIAYDTKGIWRCYEIKASKSDFYSDAKHTFVGHYNYYVMPLQVYKEVMHDIPKDIGVYIDGQYCKKNPRKRELGIDEQVLKSSLIRSLFREYEKSYMIENMEALQTARRSLDREKRNTRMWQERYRKVCLELLEERQKNRR